MMEKQKFLIILAAFFLLLLAACGGGQNGEADGAETESTETESTDTDQTSETEEATNENDESYLVGVSQIVQHPSLDNATEGFKAALEESGLNVEFDEQNAQGDQNNVRNIVNNFISSEADLIFANATPMAQGALAATQDIPVVFTSVTDPVGAELVESLEAPGGNVTGTTDLAPDAMQKSVDFMANELGAQSIGMVYSAGEQNSVRQVELAQAAAKEAGVTIEEATVATSADVLTSAESLVGKVDAFYIVTDNTVVSALESVIQVAEDNGIPLFVGELDSVDRGGFGGFGFSYHDIGYAAGEMAAAILEGEDPADVPVQTPQSLKLTLNKGAAERMGVEWKDEWDDLAEDIIE
ncbi:ABC transporter substrate-binding protein [Bacillaceae bacterium SIJ1]|uniref:ABC transporter substrate-binding protein n=1 Tax=Litoribacterium kuwaitense TaxID=1398745 RepID=UPI0013EBACD4|nr:ABC transporter substrate-binding protein [Litoribacterium kuwaitense]NGP44486.1 ABC transporter substrate-binding protein [Litoribacterium kuwaitense]